MDAYAAMTLTCLLVFDHDPDLADLLRDHAVTHAQLKQALVAGAPTERGMSARLQDRPQFNVWEREKQLIFEPVRRDAGQLGSAAVPTAATVVPADTPPAELGALTLDVIDRYGASDLPGVKPFWDQFGARTLEGFGRRARLVIGGLNDFSITLPTTEHTQRVWWPIRNDRTPLRAPLDDATAIGEALTAAVQTSRG